MTRRSETLNEGVSVINSTFPRLLKHPPAAGGWLPSGDPVDAGTMHHLSSNLSLLCRESARHLVSDVGPGGLPRTGGTYTGDGWDAAYTDSGLTGSTSTDAISHAVSWDRRTARSYHLPAMIADRELPEGGYGLRVIEVEVDCFVAAANSFRLYCALTNTYQTPDQGALALSTWSAWSTTNEQFSGANNGTPSALSATTGRQTVRMWLITNTPVGAPSAQWRCRDSGSVAAMSSLVNEGHLWVGWKSSNASNAIISINAWEVPEPFAPLVDTSVSSMLTYWMKADNNRIYQQNFSDLLIDQSSQLGNITSASLNYWEIDRSGSGGMPFHKIYHDVLNGVTRQTYATGASIVAIPADFTMFAVVTPRLLPVSGYVPVLEFNNGYPSTGGFGIRWKSSGMGAWAEDPTTGFVGSVLAVDRTYIVCARATATTVYWYVNGVAAGSVARPAAGATTVTLQIGTTTALAASNYYGDFDAAEFLYYEASLSTDARAFVLEYLNRRYGAF